MPDRDLEVADAVTGEPTGGSVSSYTVSGSTGGDFKDAIGQQVPTQPVDPDKTVSGGKVDLDLNRFLKLADKLKVVYRRTYYGIPSDPASTT